MADHHSYDAYTPKIISRHKFTTMLVFATLMALLMVTMALNLYNSSGAAQLDLSRPGYQSVRKEASQEDETASYPATGVLDKAAVDQFKAKYQTQSQKITTVDAFGGDAMTDKTLGLDGANDQSGATVTE